MLILGLLSWWYGAGWLGRLVRMRDRLDGLMDYFSLDVLFRTFFSPFRQIDAGRASGALDVQIRSFFDRQISRVIGAAIRLVIIIAGLAAIVLYTVVGFVALLAWGFTPLLPVIGIVLAVRGTIPWSP